MTFSSPIALLALILVPIAAVGYVLFERRRVREAAAFVQPALLPNVVDRVPGWRRHLPAAFLLLAVAAFLIGFARPHATVSARSEEATAIIAIDTSRSMGATDIAPTRLAAAQATARRFLKDLPGKYRVSIVAFSTLAQVVAVPTTDRQYVDTAIAGLRVGEATALGDALATSVAVARGTPEGVKPPAGEKPAPAVVLVLSDGAVDGGHVPLPEAIRRVRTAKIPVFTALLGTDAGVVTVPHVGGYVERIQVPPDPAALRRVAQQTGGSFFAAPTANDLGTVYADLKSRLGSTRENEEITFAFAVAGALLLLGGCTLSALWFRRVP
ncbi:MAG: Ca-activated chloride channel [Gaiellales bacterium]|jgi:Ca-activated chloride channel family protein|nr:Ca-activated chloride channel [Gaiellales bacterium]